MPNGNSQLRSSSDALAITSKRGLDREVGTEQGGANSFA